MNFFSKKLPLCSSSKTQHSISQIDPSYIDLPTLETGTVSTLTFTVTNHGLISATGQISLPTSHPRLRFTGDTNIGSIPANSTLVFSFGVSLVGNASIVQRRAASICTPCIQGQLAYEYTCNGPRRSQTAITFGSSGFGFWMLIKTKSNINFIIVVVLGVKITTRLCSAQTSNYISFFFLNSISSGRCVTSCYQAVQQAPPPIDVTKLTFPTEEVFTSEIIRDPLLPQVQNTVPGVSVSQPSEMSTPSFCNRP